MARIPPATHFEYTDANPVLVGAAIAAAARQREDRYAEEHIFEPLGMRNYRWTGADQTGTVSGGWGLRLRAIDMAKIGMLMLDEGRWQGRQCRPSVVVADVDPVSPRPTAQDYGYYCWINHIVEVRARVRRHGLQGTVHHCTSQGARGSRDDRDPAHRWWLAHWHLSEHLQANRE